MSEHTTRGGTPTISIQGVELARIEYQGEQVVTFAQVDTVHERPEGTAGRVFRDNRSRFVEGEDFHDVGADEMRRHLPDQISKFRGGNVILVTKRGYLKLTKPMSDDRAWAVQGEMVDRYFMVEAGIAAAAGRQVGPEAARLLKARETRLTFNGFLKVCKMIGVTGNHAVLSANGATKEMTGIDMLGMLGVPRIQSDIGGAQITVTDVGRAVGLSARQANKALVACGFSTAFRDSKDRLVYEPTDKGKRFGGRMAATGKKHSNGTPVTQLVWSTATVEALKADLASGELV